ncbi:5649_t:CDS:2 [Acaulospora morrowiae]|uniref:5649_t:CDS:1 n=1 Tax=Acaulospora morrowiae TaxID=94023 RepID=A0A9N8WA56_9GLOM|nr:5649_t:CDS:2 [Acaulospora morrowiae]
MSYSTVVWIDDPLFIKRQRVQMACSFCRQRKIRCDGRSPCSNCKKYSTDCNYVKIEKSSRGKSSIRPVVTSSVGEQNSSTNIIPTTQNMQNPHGKRPIEEDSSESQSLPPARRHTTAASQGSSVSRPEPKLPSVEDRYFLMPDKDIFDHLLSLYWVNVHPHIPVLNKSHFLQQLENPHDPPSPLLLNAMFAIAAEFSDRPHIRSDPETHENGGWIFLDRARNLIDTFLDAPRMSTIAALILMSIYQQHNTRRSGISPGYFRRWMYIGIAIRMALELDLNRELDDPHVDRSLKELRKRLWWSLFMVDVLVGCGIGKCSHLEDDEYTISEPDENESADEPELKVNGALREFICQIKFTRLLHQLLRHNFSSKVSSAFINQDIIANFEDQIRDWFIFLQIPGQTTESLVENDSNYSTMMLHLHMLFHSFIILLHRRYILNQSSLSKCVQAAQKVTPIGSLILRKYSSPFRGFLNCSTWCLLQAGMIHALNKVIGNETQDRVAEEHYEKIVHLFQKHSQITALQVLQDYANTCSSHRLSVMEAWSAAATDSREIFSLMNGSKVGNNFDNHHITNTVSSVLSSPSFVKSFLPLSSSLSTLSPPINRSPSTTTTASAVDTENNPYEILKFSNTNSFQNLSYASAATALHMSPVTNSGRFEISHLSQINTPFPSPHNGAASPMCGGTPHESPNVDPGHFTNVTSPLIDSEGTSVRSSDEFNFIPFLGKVQGINNEDWFNNNHQSSPSSQHGTWQQNLGNSNYTRFSLASPHPVTPPSTSTVDLFGKHENAGHISSPIKKLGSPVVSSPAHASSSNMSVFYPEGIHTPIIRPSPTTSPFHSPTQHEVGAGMSSNIIPCDKTPSVGATSPANYSHLTNVGSNRHENATGYFVGGGFSGLGICSN